MILFRLFNYTILFILFYSFLFPSYSRPAFLDSCCLREYWGMSHHPQKAFAEEIGLKIPSCTMKGHHPWIGRRLGTWPYLAADLGPWQASQVGLACCQNGQVNLTLLYPPPMLRASVKVTHLSYESFQCLGCPSPS